ncbi:GAF domain-containing sensor histidine kinase [Roseospira goensis]|uniref:histidine kinase n=1 Tax=Roseospira goensis TaxID=391922 RepID=A0A7W6RZD9_9PROT|nr:GAF domain-containing sensor histidine kinase [Roseospira goensis]MBB4286041.1 signal transduction histidine kinase [Roseospira goensis]
MNADSRGYRSAPLPSDERERLQSLHRYALLDSEPEPALDRLAMLTARLLGVPIALVSLVDAERQVLMARCGLETRETSRDVAFCAHAIHSDDILEIPDTHADPRFAGNPLVVGPPFIRSYAGKPLVDRHGHRLGTLCAIDCVARPPLDAGARATLTDLAATVMDLIEMRAAALDAETERQRAQRMAELKDDYLSAMAHELRTPVTALTGFGQLLKASGAAATLTETQRGYLETIVESAEYLGLLVRETLDTQAEAAHAGGPSAEVVDLGAAMTAVGELIAPLAARQSLTVAVRPPPAEVRVWGDALRLRQVLVNLMSNAVKYNRPEGSVRLSASVEADAVHIVCADTGCGIPAEELPRLFRRYHRVAATSDGIEGSGLGLRITRRLVQMMGGRIVVESQEGEGTTFTVTLLRASC